MTSSSSHRLRTGTILAKLIFNARHILMEKLGVIPGDEENTTCKVFVEKSNLALLEMYKKTKFNKQCSLFPSEEPILFIGTVSIYLEEVLPENQMKVELWHETKFGHRMISEVIEL